MCPSLMELCLLIDSYKAMVVLGSRLVWSRFKSYVFCAWLMGGRDLKLTSGGLWIR